MVPESGLVAPLIKLNSVVLPAPLGPITEVTLPTSTLIVALFTALIPPKATATSFTSRIRLFKDHLLALTEDALWATYHQYN